MLAYIDSSVLLRIIFDEPSKLAEIGGIGRAVSSELIRVECLRTADRYRIRNEVPEAEHLERISLVRESLKRIELVRVSPDILDRAGQPFPSSLGTLDAIHLATSLLYRERGAGEMVFCTHDRGLMAGAKAMGFEVLG